MIEQLLKDMSKKSTSEDPSRPTKPRNILSHHPQDQNQEQKDNTYKSPSNKFNQTRSERSSQLRQTPGFFQKLQAIGHDIQFINDDEVQAIQQYEPNGRYSEVHSVVSEQNPMILSTFQNLDKNMGNKLVHLKIRNAVSQLKQVHFDLIQYLEDEKRHMENFKESLCIDVEDFVLAFMHQIRDKTSSSYQLQQAKKDNMSLLIKLQKRQSDYQKINRELTEMKNSLQGSQRNVAIRRGASRDELSKSSACNSCKAYEQRINNLKEEIKQGEQEIEKLLIENERLQQTIFDLQQKIVGVDLQVEKKFKQKMKFLPESSRQIKQVSQPDNSQQLNRLRQDVVTLKVKCREYEDKISYFAEYEDRITKNQIKEHDLTQRQMMMRQAKEQLQEERQAAYQREHQILEAQQNLSKKIADLREKQAELSSWETQLICKANESRPPLNLNFASEQQQMGLRVASHDNLGQSRQMSIRSFGRNPNFQAPQEYHPNNPSKRNYTQHELQIFDPKQQLKKMNRPDSRYQSGSGRRLQLPQRRAYGDNDYQMKAAQHLNTGARNMKLVSSNYQNSRETSPYRTINEHRSRGHQGVGGHYRDLSKNSRSSATKSIRGNFGVQNHGIKQRGETPQMTGLSSKLERLREQIKKEIDSIK